MKQEDKELLLKDICARLPYGVYCYLSICTHTPYKLYAVFNKNYTRDIFDFETLRINPDIIKVKPYLRPMSSMTDEEHEELMKYIGNTQNVIDFYNSHHLDYRGLIPKCLALEAPEGMYNNISK